MCIDERMYQEQRKEMEEAEKRFEDYMFQKNFDEWLHKIHKQKEKKDGCMGQHTDE